MPAATKSPSGAPARSLTQTDGRPQRGEPHPDEAGAAEERPSLRASANINVLLLSPPDYIASAKVSDMLLAVPKYGHVKVNKILAQCRISPSKTIGGLSQRQRAELVSHFRK